MAYTGTYFVPTFVHVWQHFFKRPIAIVVPPQRPLTHTSRPSADDDESLAGASHYAHSEAVQTSSSRTGTSKVDELLLRKERALQKRQFRRRILWDIGVWVLLIASVMGFVGYVGFLASAW